MRTKTEKLTALGLGVCLATQLTWAQGSLTPPGAPAPTMKTLEQIEPRRLIAATGYRITQPGSYYLATNLITADGISGIPAIQIFTNDVTIDLNGFSILGESGGGNGIQVNPNCWNVLVRNGTIRDCYDQGLYARDAEQCAFEDLRILNNGRSTSHDGLQAGNFARVVNCRIEGNGGEGLEIGDASEIRGCAIVSNTDGLVVGGDGRIEGNTIMNNANDGLRITGSSSYVADNIVKGNTDNYDLAAGNQLNLLICEIPESLDWPCSARLAGTLTSPLTSMYGITVNADDVTIDLGGHTLIGPGTSSGSGIYQDYAFRNLTVRNGKVVNWGGWAGISAFGTGNQLHGLQAATNYYGIMVGNGNTLSDCTASYNSGYGIYAVSSGGTLRNCTASDNSYGGIYANSGWTISDCTAYHNNYFGFSASFGCSFNDCVAKDNISNGIVIGIENRIEHCVSSYNGYLSGSGDGIHVVGHDNRIDGNNVTWNHQGIDVDGTGNFIARNTASGNAINWDIVAGNVCLVVQANNTTTAISGDAGGIDPGSTDPNANFTY